MSSMQFVLPVAPKMAGADDVAIAGARSTPLTSEQRQKLARVARRAFDAQQALGLAEGDFDAWRHAQCREALGRGGLCELDQGCYGRAMAHFVGMAGGTPYRQEWRTATKPARRDDADRARRALRDECGRQAEVFGGAAQADAYATSLLAGIHKTDWMSATAKQLWQVLFTLRNRARAKRRVNGPARPLRNEARLDRCAGGEAASRTSAVQIEALGAVGAESSAGKRESGHEMRLTGTVRPTFAIEVGRGVPAEPVSGRKAGS